MGSIIRDSANRLEGSMASLLQQNPLNIVGPGTHQMHLQVLRVGACREIPQLRPGKSGLLDCRQQLGPACIDLAIFCVEAPNWRPVSPVSDSYAPGDFAPLGPRNK